MPNTLVPAAAEGLPSVSRTGGTASFPPEILIEPVSDGNGFTTSTARTAGLSRRGFLKAAGAAGAAGVVAAPAVAEAFTGGADTPTDRQRLDGCMGELKAVLARLHPVVTDIEYRYYPQDDGTFRVWISCNREFLQWSGPGFYRVSDNGHVMTWWLERVEERMLSGKVYGFAFVAEMYLEDEGRFVGESRRMWEPKILEKLDELTARQAGPARAS